MEGGDGYARERVGEWEVDEDGNLLVVDRIGRCELVGARGNFNDHGLVVCGLGQDPVAYGGEFGGNYQRGHLQRRD